MTSLTSFSIHQSAIFSARQKPERAIKAKQTHHVLVSFKKPEDVKTLHKLLNGLAHQFPGMIFRVMGHINPAWAQQDGNEYLTLGLSKDLIKDWSGYWSHPYNRFMLPNPKVDTDSQGTITVSNSKHWLHKAYYLTQHLDSLQWAKTLPQNSADITFIPVDWHQFLDIWKRDKTSRQANLTQGKLRLLLQKYRTAAQTIWQILRAQHTRKRVDTQFQNQLKAKKLQWSQPAH